ncbi:3D (Asp-Asp-Asp) domain-containing protein [Paenibacillus sp. UNCCL117]|uniref:3D domain-containing protein n=1 Tax=unclassified Paenibacillus TaxID=185978 RepID=UPI000883FD63|nr:MULTISPECIES: 3D domain-containing protein [unclassified Paenibacillus]SDB98681.1 3D (Asp-Asp-Asp) domain-containing protein [Paenibacillus sp. cl123]SFW68988.1 3D (Asp-Asp-Asp) domain-containing protein [Paenibacillus sp. UNCCL117]
MNGMTRCVLTLLALLCAAAASALPPSLSRASGDPYESIFVNDFYIASEDPELLENTDSLDHQTVLLPSAIPYEVQSGDTLYAISRSFGVSVHDIVSTNGLASPDRLSIGMKLDIPVREPALQWADGRTNTVKQVLSTTLTAYTAGVESTGKSPSHPQYGITYSGSKAEEGRTIAVDPKIIPIGTTVFIDGIGIRKAEDTGSAIRGARIDVFMQDVNEALQFGVKKNVKVYVLSSDQTDTRS